MSKYKYILCPSGNGIDTHRMWEALYSNSIPIIFSEHKLGYFNKIPAVVLSRFSDLSQLKPEDLNINENEQQFLKLEEWINLIKYNLIKSNETTNFRN